MREMALDDLINLLWSSLEIKKGTHYFYEKLEEELSKRIRGVKDDQYESLLACFSGNNYSNEFSDKFFKLVVNVIEDKKDRFQIATIIKVIWAFAKLDFKSDHYDTLKVLQSFASYERLISNLPMLSQKNQIILLWTYSRDQRLLENENCMNFIENVIDSILRY